MPTFEVRNAKGLGAAIKHVRSTRGVSQDQLAEELNISRRYLNELENGAPNLWSTRLFRALRRLGIKVTVSYEIRGRKDDG